MIPPQHPSNRINPGIPIPIPSQSESTKSKLLESGKFKMCGVESVGLWVLPIGILSSGII